MRETEISQPGDGCAVAFDQPSGEGVGAGEADLLAGDGLDPRLEGVPGTPGPESGTGRQQRSDEGVAAEPIGAASTSASRLKIARPVGHVD